jgi:serine-type D-Ala-D-Ala carboxypeptidase/endopeptidase
MIRCRLSTKLSLAVTITTLIACAQSVSVCAEDIVLKEATSNMGWLVIKAGAPGLVLGVVRGGESIVLGFGETRRGSKVEPNGHSILRLGSVAKVMAGQVLASMVTDGIVKLADPLAKFAPPGAKIPAVADRQITLLDLATHTAGLRRELPGAPDPTLGQKPSSLEADAYWRWLSDASLPYTPGSGAIYSNLGFSLLGEALAKADGKPYPTLLRQHIADPLGMTDTVTKLSEAQMQRAMTGIDHDGKAVPLWEMPPVMDASGNLFTTGDDMIRWMRWHLAVNDAVGAEVRIIDHAAYRTYDGLKVAVGVDMDRMDGLGLGWMISLPKETHPLMLTKSGALPGFATYVALAPTRGVGVFVAVNRAFPGFCTHSSQGHRPRERWSFLPSPRHEANRFAGSSATQPRLSKCSETFVDSDHLFRMKT